MIFFEEGFGACSYCCELNVQDVKGSLNIFEAVFFLAGGCGCTPVGIGVVAVTTPAARPMAQEPVCRRSVVLLRLHSFALSSAPESYASFGFQVLLSIKRLVCYTASQAQVKVIEVPDISRKNGKHET